MSAFPVPFDLPPARHVNEAEPISLVMADEVHEMASRVIRSFAISWRSAVRDRRRADGRAFDPSANPGAL